MIRHIVVVAMLFAPTGTVLAADEKPVTVTIHCDHPELTKGLPVRVLKREWQRNGLVPVDLKEKLTLDPTGNAAVDLPPGVYEFEILHAADDGTVVCLQSVAIDPAQTQAVTISAADPIPVSLTHEKQPLTIGELAVRSVAVSGQARWKRTAAGQVPRLVIAAKSQCMLNVIASAGPTYAAVWMHIDPNTAAAFITRPAWNICQFAWRNQSPTAKETVANLYSPDAKIEVPVRPNVRFITNRKFFRVGYTASFADGTVMTFQPIGENLDPTESFEFGGDLTPHAWAANLWQDTGTLHFTWRYAVVDSDGRIVTADKESGITASIARVDGKEVPKDLVDPATRQELGDLTQSLKVALNWQWGKPQKRIIPPEPTVELRSERFKIEAVPFWTWQSRNYLSKMERYHLVERSTTSLPGPASINIDWRYNTNNAKAIIGGAKGGGQWLWMSVPFRGYEVNQDPFNEPQFTGHEMLHTFGYNHGEEMSRLQNLVEGNFADERWRMVDEPAKGLQIQQGEVVPVTKKKK